MARQLSIEEKRNIVLLYLDGHSQQAIAKKTRRSIGIVNAVISDWETGKGIEPESGLLSGEIREIARFMKEKNLSISDLDEMFITAAVLKESGLNKASMLNIKEISSFSVRVGFLPPDIVGFIFWYLPLAISI